jgi:hypothetical protein
MEMELKVTASIDVDEEWASNFTASEICESVRDRLSSSLGFRGNLVKLKVAINKEKATYRPGKDIKSSNSTRNNAPI